MLFRSKLYIQEKGYSGSFKWYPKGDGHEMILLSAFNQIISKVVINDDVDMSTFMQLANLEGQQNIADVVDTMKKLILDEKGNKILNDKNILPNDVMIKAVEKTVVALGNFATPTSKI